MHLTITLCYGTYGAHRAQFILFAKSLDQKPTQVQINTSSTAILYFKANQHELGFLYFFVHFYRSVVVLRPQTTTSTSYFAATHFMWPGLSLRARSTFLFSFQYSNCVCSAYIFYRFHVKCICTCITFCAIRCKQ